MPRVHWCSLLVVLLDHFFRTVLIECCESPCFHILHKRTDLLIVFSEFLQSSSESHQVCVWWYLAFSFELRLLHCPNCLLLLLLLLSFVYNLGFFFEVLLDPRRLDF